MKHVALTLVVLTFANNASADCRPKSMVKTVLERIEFTNADDHPPTPYRVSNIRLSQLKLADGSYIVPFTCIKNGLEYIGAMRVSANCEISSNDRDEIMSSRDN